MAKNKMTVAKAVQLINKKGLLLVFPQENRKEPASLWYEFFPRTKMRWEWDESGDNRVGELWHLRERLSLSRKTIYAKWFRGRATLISLDLFPAMLKLANPEFPHATGLSFTARDILDILDEDSPLSTKQLKKLSGLQGRASEATYQRALKELWDRLLIVAYGEVDEGAFPSIAVGSSRVIFEDLWNEAGALSIEDAQASVDQRLVEGSAFRKYWDSLVKKWNARHGDVDLRSKDSINDWWSSEQKEP
jgi:hypothetical protein